MDVGNEEIDLRFVTMAEYFEQQAECSRYRRKFRRRPS